MLTDKGVILLNSRFSDLIYLLYLPVFLMPEVVFGEGKNPAIVMAGLTEFLFDVIGGFCAFDGVI
jgi:hypothetical protein